MHLGRENWSSAEWEGGSGREDGGKEEGAGVTSDPIVIVFLAKKKRRYVSRARRAKAKRGWISHADISSLLTGWGE